MTYQSIQILSQTVELFNFRPAKLISTFERNWTLKTQFHNIGCFPTSLQTLMFPLSTFAVVIINYERKCRTFGRSLDTQPEAAGATKRCTRNFLSCQMALPYFLHLMMILTMNLTQTLSIFEGIPLRNSLPFVTNMPSLRIQLLVVLAASYLCIICIILSSSRITSNREQTLLWSKITFPHLLLL